MKLRLGLFCGFLIAISGNVLSQDQRIADSLIKVLNVQELDDSLRSILHRKTAYYSNNLVASLGHADTAIWIARNVGDLILEAEALEERSQISKLLGNPIESIELSLTALANYEKLGMQSRQAAIFVQIGSVESVQANYNSSIGYLLKALIIYEQNPLSLNYGLTLVNLGEAYRLNQQLDSAAYYFRKALSANEEIQNETISGYALGNLGMTLMASDQLDTAKVLIRESIALLEPLGDDYSVSVYLGALASIVQKEGDTKQSERFYLQALNLARGQGLKEQIRDLGMLLSNFYDSLGDHRQSLAYLRESRLYADSILNKNSIKKMEQLKAQYTLDKQASQIQLLDNENKLKSVLSASFGVGLLAFLYLSVTLYRKSKKERSMNLLLVEKNETIEQREAEKAILLKELNHRVKNNLQIISSLLNLQSYELGEHPAAEALNSGRYRVEAMSLIHQKLYQEDVHTKIDMSEYVSDLVTNLFYSYDAKWEPEIQVTASAVSIDVAVPLGIVINELVSNALKYAYTGVDKPKLTISLSKNEAQIHLIVTDNGLGFNPDHLDHEPSFGLKLVESLSQQLEASLAYSVDAGWKMTFTEK